MGVGHCSAFALPRSSRLTNTDFVRARASVSPHPVTPSLSVAMGKLQDVTRLLMAAGGSPSADGKVTYLFREKDNSLYMETWTGPELTDNVRVVSNVRSDAPAPLVFLQYKVRRLYPPDPLA